MLLKSVAELLSCSRKTLTVNNLDHSVLNHCASNPQIKPLFFFQFDTKIETLIPIFSTYRPIEEKIWTKVKYYMAYRLRPVLFRNSTNTKQPFSHYKKWNRTNRKIKRVWWNRTRNSKDCCNNLIWLLISLKYEFSNE